MNTPTSGLIMAGCDREAIKAGWRIERYKPRGADGHGTGRPERRYLSLVHNLAIWVTFIDASPASRLTAMQYNWLQVELKGGRFAVAIDSIRAFDRLLQLASRDRHEELLRMCKGLVEFGVTKDAEHLQ